METQPCDECDGEGYVLEHVPFRGRWQEDPGWLREVPCPDCAGTGEVEREDDDDDDDDEEDDDVET